MTRRVVVHLPADPDPQTPRHRSSPAALVPPVASKNSLMQRLGSYYHPATPNTGFW